MNKDVMILWRMNEAINSNGFYCKQSYGSQMKYLNPGDNLFVCATENNELYLCGLIHVLKVKKVSNGNIINQFGNYKVQGENKYGPFHLINLKKAKWNLRFKGSNSKLSKTKSISLQLLQHRELEKISSNLFMKILKLNYNKFSKGLELEKREFIKEGKVLTQSVSRRERDPRIRKYALRKYGYNCAICGFNFEETYGDFNDCIEVHHLDPIGLRKSETLTKFERVIVLCPNCHRAIHRLPNPADIESLKIK